MAGYSPHIPFPVYENIGDVVDVLGLNPLALPGHPHLWFVRCLFLCVVLSPFIACIVRRIRCLWWWALIFALTVCVLLWVEMTADPFLTSLVTFYYSIEGVFYFSFGMALRLRGGVKGKLGRGAFAVGVLLFCIPAICSWYTGRTLEALTYGLRLMATPLLMYGLWSIMPRRNVFGPLSGCAFPIYILHKFVLLLIAGVAGMFGMREYLARESVVLYFGRMVLVVAMVCLFVKVLERVSPKVAALLFGGRTSLRIRRQLRSEVFCHKKELPNRLADR